MSEVKPVAWRWKEDNSNFMYGAALPLTFNRARHSWQPLYSADAIEALQAECERLREELAAAQKDKRELLQQLRSIRMDLYAATVQRSPADDKIISDHVEQAYLRANEVIESVEKRDE